MNTPAEAGAPRGARGRIRARGGGGRGGLATATRGGKPPGGKPRLLPGRLTDLEYVKDPALGQDTFVILLGSTSGVQQWTFHRPIGKTDLDERDWVATPSSEIEFLVKRKSSEEHAAWERRAQLSIRQAVLRTRTGRRTDENGQETWTFEDAPAIGPTIIQCQRLAKDAGESESAWLNHAPPAVQVAETAFKTALKRGTVSEEWIRANPEPYHRTCGGPLGDRPQQAVGYLRNLSAGAAKDCVQRRMLGLAEAGSIIPAMMQVPGGGETPPPVPAVVEINLDDGVATGQRVR